MPTINTRVPSFNPKRDLEADYKNFARGLNLLLRPTELKKDEYSQGDNIMIDGSGTLKGRWGSSHYFTAGATGSIRGLGSYVNTEDEVNQVIALTDQGYLQKKNGVVSTQIPGMSYPSGSVMRFEQLGGYSYFVSKDKPLARYDGSTLTVFATLSPPSGLSVTNYSGASGNYTWSWRVSTLSSSGFETTASTAVELGGLPQTLNETQVRLFWTLATGDIGGYQIYRGLPSDERLLSSVGASTSTFIDNGEPASETILPPLTNTTGGVQSFVAKRYKDRLLMVDALDPSKLLISGRYPKQGSFNWVDGGGYVYIDPDPGRNITGIEVQQSADRIVVYKDYSHYAVELSTVQIGNFTVLDPQYQPISVLIGASNQDTLQTVENDTFYFGRKGIYVTGYEPNFLNIIRTNEVSARIRPYLDLLNDDDYRTACAMYVDNKYLLSFPLRREIIVYDRERGAFAGLWKFPYGISHMMKHVDITGTEVWIAGSSESNKVYYFNPNVKTDDGVAIAKTLRLNKEDFGSWSILKIVKYAYFLFRNVSGQVNVSILVENRDGTTSTPKSFTIQGAALNGQIGWGSNLWGDTILNVGESNGGSGWGTSSGSPVTGSDELTRYTQLFKTARLVQVEISTTDASSDFELLRVRLNASSMGEGSLSSSSRV